MLSRAEFLERFRDFVRGLDNGTEVDRVGPGDNLFDAGVLDSFSVIKVIVFLEEVTGGPVDLEEASIESFATVDSIYDNLVARATRSAVD